MARLLSGLVCDGFMTSSRGRRQTLRAPMPLWTLENFVEPVRRPAKPRSLAGPHHRPLDQKRVLGHRRNQLGVGPFGLVEAEIVIGCAAPAQQLARAYSHLLERRADFGRTGRSFEVFDDPGLNAPGADRGQNLARRATLGVVPDGDRGG